jgi:hypothetical protein
MIEPVKQSPKKQTRQRSRSRSRSITPPPTLSVHQIEHAKHIVRYACQHCMKYDSYFFLVRQALAKPLRAPSPTPIISDPVDAIPLDPELAQIAKAIRNEPSRSNSITVDPSEINGPEVVTIKVKWHPHPLNLAARPFIWGFKIRRVRNIMCEWCN